MPVNYRYDESANRLMTRCEGDVNLSEVAEHFRKLGRDARLKPHCDVLLDLAFLTRLPSPEQVDDVATMIEDMIELVPFGRCAVIAGEEIGFALGRMFQGFTWPLFTGIRLFRLNAEAIGWLDTTAD
jgi:hypothetical protein